MVRQLPSPTTGSPDTDRVDARSEPTDGRLGPTGEPVSPWPPRHRIPLGSFIAIGAVVAAGGLWWLLSTADPAGPWFRLVVPLGAAVAVVVIAALARLLVGSVAGRRRLSAELERVRRRVAIDELTGLANRQGIAVEIDRRLAIREPGELVAVLFCDLDRLRVINDSLGHIAGDEVLVLAARRLSRIVRQQDRLGRFGGDQFVVVTSGLPAIRDLELLAARLVEAMREPTALADGTAQVVSGSVGIAYAAAEQRVTSGELLRDAAVATEAAKRAGGDGHSVFDASQRAEAVARLSLEQELRAGLRHGQIAVHYQPIVSCADGRVDRVEALIRWDHPQRGTILPGDFLPVAAQSRLMVDLGRIVLTRACEQAVLWSEANGRPISVAVNVGERQLLDLGLVDTVTGVLAETGLPAEQLELEVTEELILDRLERSLLVLRQLDLLGVRLAIDDFGTSQASLGRLKELAMVSTLKIDRLFVDGIATDPVDRKIVAAIVALASTVGMEVVAEGVETAAQARVLADLGVEHLQGFLFTRPGSADAVAPIFARPQRHRWQH